MQEVFETLTETGEDYATALGKLNAYFKPQKNIPFERHTFRQAFQDPSETMDAYVTRLKRLVQTCDYGDSSDEMIRDQVLENRHVYVADYCEKRPSPWTLFFALQEPWKLLIAKRRKSKKTRCQKTRLAVTLLILSKRIRARETRAS